MNQKAFANAFAVLIAFVYITCVAWVMVARDGFMSVTGSWIHGIDMKSLPYMPPTAGSLGFGFVTAIVAAWISAYVFVWLYNQFAKK